MQSVFCTFLGLILIGVPCIGMGGGEQSLCQNGVPQWAPLERNSPNYTGTIDDKGQLTPVIEVSFSTPTLGNKAPLNATTILRGVKEEQDDSYNVVDLAHIEKIIVTQARYHREKDNADYVKARCIFHNGQPVAEKELLFPINTVIAATEVSTSSSDQGSMTPHRMLGKAWWLRDLSSISLQGVGLRLPPKKEY